MRIESFSIRAVTVIIFLMIGVVAIILSILAGSYFKRAALDAQMTSLSRVIEVASQEMLKQVKSHTFDLGMKLGHSNELIRAINDIDQTGGRSRLVDLLDDPFINGFVGFSNINLEKIRVYGLDLNLLVESKQGIEGLDKSLADYLINKIGRRQGIERLKAMDALWMSPKGPMFSTLVPIGGLRLIGYLEIIVNPVFNLPDIGKITETPISVYSVTGELINIDEQRNENSSYLPIKFVLNTSDGQPAFRIIGYEDVAHLNAEMDKTQIVTISGFLLLSLSTLMFALWLFSRFLFVPLRRMINDMEKMTHGRLDLTINKKGLREFYILATTFNSMANQVRVRTNELERLLDLDGSAILGFGNDNEAVYFNKSATGLFGYTSEEITDLDLSDLFADDIQQLMADFNESGEAAKKKLHTQLNCISKAGDVFRCDAIISLIDVKDEGGYGYALVLSPVSESSDRAAANNSLLAVEHSDQRIDVIEQSLNSLLEIAKNDPGLLSSLTHLDQSVLQGTGIVSDKVQLREQAVAVMRSAMTCWEHDMGKTKLDLAEESKIWPVYIDKSTPTTRTLDKYLNLESCPKNPRSQRVIDTAEFVLRKTKNQQTPHRQKLEEELAAFRLSRSGA
ncbi:MAG: PAS domain-containing protein [Gammaproteobacteria bacterium]|nr:PAS domain-containing protein [Gammaproteobacteria bacterium]